jgi:hypothetical protein
MTMKKLSLIYLLSFMLTFLSNFSFGQTVINRTCGTEIPTTEWDNWFNKKVKEFKSNLENGKSQIVNYTIPVVIHVIHGGQTVGTFPNLSQLQINSQITVLNDDFAGNGYNSQNTPTVFTSNKSNTGVSFCLAIKNPTGGILSEPGIDRVNYNSITTPTSTTYPSKNPSATNYNTPTKFQSFINGYIKPSTIWDPTKYMNIWITDEQSSVGLLGYATFPAGTGLTGLSGFGTATTDGLWCWSKAFGSNVIYPGGVYDPTYNKGRTTTHEIGHWVGLRHIWGDGTCATDYCNDTPPSQTSNFGCPTHPYKLGTCAGNTTGEMFMNDQTIRIQTAMANGTYRSLLTSNSTTLCSINVTLKENFESNQNIIIYPNPSKGIININKNYQTLEILIYNSLGQIVKNLNTEDINNQIDISNLNNGIYFVKFNNKHEKIVKLLILNK